MYRNDLRPAIGSSPRRGWVPAAVLVAALAALLVVEPRPVVPFRLERAAACRGQQNGLPLEPGHTFEVGRDRICVWFDGREGTFATTVRASVWREEPERLVATSELIVPRRSAGGAFSLSLQSGSPLPVGKYAVHVRSTDTHATVRFQVVAGPADVAFRANAHVHSDPDAGFALSIPHGWERTAFEESALALLHEGHPLALALVIVRHEPADTSAAAVAEAVGSAAASALEYRVRTRVAGAIGDRRVSTLVLDRDDGARLKVVVIPREEGPAARTFYGLVLTSAAASFGVVEPEFDRMVLGFRVLPPRLP